MVSKELYRAYARAAAGNMRAGNGNGDGEDVEDVPADEEELPKVISGPLQNLPQQTPLLDFQHHQDDMFQDDNDYDDGDFDLDRKPSSSDRLREMSLLNLQRLDDEKRGGRLSPVRESSVESEEFRSLRNYINEKEHILLSGTNTDSASRHSESRHSESRQSTSVQSESRQSERSSTAPGAVLSPVRPVGKPDRANHAPPAASSNRRNSRHGGNNNNNNGRQERRKSNSSAASSGGVLGNIRDEIRHLQARRARRPRYERATRPGAVQMFGRAFGAARWSNRNVQAPNAPRRSDEETPANQAEDGISNDISSPSEPQEEQQSQQQSQQQNQPQNQPRREGQEQPQFVVVEGKTINSIGNLMRRDKRVVALAVAGLLMLLANAILFVVFIAFMMTKSVPSSPSGIKDITDALSRYTPTSILNNPTTAQHDALRWMDDVDELHHSFDSPLFPQRYAMVVFYFATTEGGGWTNSLSWLNPRTSECDWGFVTCGDFGEVTRINIDANDLKGFLPPELSLLNYLRHLSLNENALDGRLTAAMGSLTSLETLHLSENFLTGEIPVTIGSLTNLKLLHLSGNRLRGTFPMSFYDLTSLTSLDLSDNEFNGMIDESLSQLSSLNFMDLSINALVGGLPKSLASLSRLEFIHLDDNELVGDLPSSTKFLLSRVEVTLSSNYFTGSIPDGTLENVMAGSDLRIERLDMKSNKLRGPIPKIFRDLSSLQHLDLSRNLLTGTIPDLANLDSLESLMLFENKLSGTIPKSLPPKLNKIDMQDNKFVGHFPTEIGLLTHLQTISFQNNNDMNGPIPTELGLLSNLEIVNFNYLRLNGQIPKEISALSNLRKFEVYGNTFSGTIPPEFGQLSSLRRLNLGGNSLTGIIPPTFGQLVNINDLRLDGNDLTGDIPAELAGLAKMEKLQIAFNKLEGGMPQEICLLKESGNLELLRVDCSITCDCCGDCETGTELCSMGTRCR